MNKKDRKLANKNFNLSFKKWKKMHKDWFNTKKKSYKFNKKTLEELEVLYVAINAVITSFERRAQFEFDNENVKNSNEIELAIKNIQEKQIELQILIATMKQAD